MIAETPEIIFMFKITRTGKVEFVGFTLPRMEKNDSGEFFLKKSLYSCFAGRTGSNGSYFLGRKFPKVDMRLLHKI